MVLEGRGGAGQSAAGEQRGRGGVGRGGRLSRRYWH